MPRTIFKNSFSYKEEGKAGGREGRVKIYSNFWVRLCSICSLLLKVVHEPVGSEILGSCGNEDSLASLQTY